MTGQRHIEMDAETTERFRAMLNFPKEDPLPVVLVNTWRRIQGKFDRVGAGMRMSTTMLVVISELAGINVWPGQDMGVPTEDVWQSWRRCYGGVPVIIDDPNEGEIGGTFFAVVQGDGRKVEVRLPDQGDRKVKRQYPVDRIRIAVPSELDIGLKGHWSQNGTTVLNPTKELECDD